MRIAMLTNNYKPFVGGVPISIERLAKGLRSLGHEVYIFAPSYEGQEDEPYVIRYRSRKKKLKGEFVIPDILDKTIEEKFAAVPFDIIHVHHPMLMGYIAQYLHKKYDIPIVFTYHTRYEQYLHYLKPYDFVQKIYLRNSDNRLRSMSHNIIYSGGQKLVAVHNRIFTNLCSMVFAPTESMKQYLIDNGTCTNIEVVPTGINAEDFYYDEETAEKIRSGYIGDNKFLLCSVSRLEREKNISFMLEGLALLKKRRGGCFRLLLIGDGSQKEELMSEAEMLDLTDNVIFTGCIEHSQMRNYYRACDVFVFASRSETQGIVLLEAMAAGLPVVAVEASGVNDVVTDGWNGYKTEPSVSDWEKKLEIILDDAELRNRMRQNAEKRAKEYLSSNIAKKVEKLYQSLLYEKNMERVYENRII